MDTWDYLVVGGGHNGLTAACTLAGAGASVLVLEQLTILGGLATSHPYLPEAPQHVLSLGAMDDMFMSSTSIATDLGLARYGGAAARLEAPYGWIGEDGETLLLFADFDRTLDEVKRYSRKDARTYAELRPALDWIVDAQTLVMSSRPNRMPKAQLAKHLLKLAPSRSIRRWLGKMLSCNLVEMAADTFESDAMRSLVTYWGSMIGPVDLDGGGFYCVGLAAVHRSPGVMRPRGGMGGVIKALAAHLVDHGGDVRTHTAVERILVGDNGAEGVRLTDGTELRARRGVLAALPPQIAFGRLLDDHVLDSATKAKVAMLPASANNVAFFKIDIALAGRATFPKAAEKRHRIDSFDVRRTSLMSGTFNDQISQLKAMRVGRWLEDPPVYMAVLSANDASLAPPGQDVLYICADVPAGAHDGWDMVKAAVSQSIMRTVTKHIAGLDSEMGRIETSPADFGAVYGSPNGSYFHVDMTPMRLGSNRPARGLGGYTTPVPGYYLAASGVHPGGGVSGWPGRLAAQTALEADRPDIDIRERPLTVNEGNF